MISRAFRNSVSVIVNGGANLMMSPCVGLAKTPFSANFTQIFQASYSSEMTTALRRPFPRTFLTISLSKEEEYYIIDQGNSRSDTGCSGYSDQGIAHRGRLKYFFTIKI